MQRLTEELGKIPPHIAMSAGIASLFMFAAMGAVAGYWQPDFGVLALLAAASGLAFVARRDYWLEFSIGRRHLSLLRVALFSVVALHAWMQVGHAARYGAGDFNVSHLPFLDWFLPIPSRPGILIAHIVEAFLALRVAFGVATAVSIKLLTGLYGYCYFVSQLDSYQHHYLVFLVLLLSCFVPWSCDKPDTKGADTPVKSWALQLIIVQLAIVYGWAAVAKMESSWLSGQTLRAQLTEPWIVEFIQHLGTSQDPAGFASVARLVLAQELCLAILLLFPRTRTIALVVGVGLHISIELANFEIGEFSYFMFALYLALLPPRVARPLTKVLNAVQQTMRRAGEAWPLAALPTAVAGLAAAAACSLPLPFDQAPGIAACIVILGILALRPAIRRQHPTQALGIALAHVVAAGILLVASHVSDQSFEYYKFWAGIARRLNDEAAMETAYRRLMVLRPDYSSSYYYVGNLHRKRGEADAALALYRRGQNARPSDHRCFRAEASMHVQAGRPDEALATFEREQKAAPKSPGGFIGAAQLHFQAGNRNAARQALDKALSIDPANRQARALLRRMR